MLSQLKHLHSQRKPKASKLLEGLSAEDLRRILNAPHAHLRSSSAYLAAVRLRLQALENAEAKKDLGAGI